MLICFQLKCNKKAKSYAKCNYCTKLFCMKHRLPESHNCLELVNCKRKAFEENKRIMKKQKCIASKLV